MKEMYQKQNNRASFGRVTVNLLEHPSIPLKYRFDSQTFISELQPFAGNVIADAINNLDWDEILQRAANSAAEGLGAGVISMILGSNRWEQQIAEDLQKVISKLDVILDEIRELRKYIRDSNRANTRAALQADLIGPIITLTDYMRGIRAAGELDDSLRRLFELATNDLTLGLSRVVKYQEPESDRPLGIPLYASIEAGLIMLIIAHKALEIPDGTTKAQVETYIGTFAEWQSVLKTDADAWLGKINAETAFLIGFPHRGALEGGGPKNSPTLFDCTGGNMASICYGVIDGGIDKPFKFERVDVEEYDTHQIGASIPTELFPFPYTYHGPGGCMHLQNNKIVGGDSTAAFRAILMVKDLNSRRSVLLENAEQLRKLQLVVDSLGTAQLRLRNLVGSAGG
ncbi:hypothetical protein [Cupriavidus sp. RAF12]|uniref:hypothetical protein n=1 Tax=Cupriavidus sp. RAF12 TaxID=3233050 RepID=UPI003F8DD385